MSVSHGRVDLGQACLRYTSLRIRCHASRREDMVVELQAWMAGEHQELL